MNLVVNPSAKISPNKIIQVQGLDKPKIVKFYSSEIIELSESSEGRFSIRMDASHCQYLKKHVLARDTPAIDFKAYKEFRGDYEKKRAACSLYDEPMAPFLLYLEQYVSQNEFVRFDTTRLFEAEIICHASILTKLMMVHGNIQESFSLLATRYKGNIYLTRQIKPQDSRKESLRVAAKHAMFSDHPNTDANTEELYSNKFNCVYDWKLSKFSVRYFSSVQGVDSDTEITPDTLPHNIKVAKIKVRVLSDILRQHPSYLSPYWWCESYIYGYPDIHRVNVKDDETVESIDTVNVDQYIEEPKKQWKKSSDDRVSFVSLMFESIMQHMKNVDSPHTVYKFFSMGADSVHFETHPGPNELTFLSEQFINKIKDL